MKTCKHLTYTRKFNGASALFGCCLPVSYTHLDVYKRQSFASALFEESLLKMFVILVLRACIHAEQHLSLIHI